MAIAGTRRSAKEMADGTLRVAVDIEPRDKARFHALFPEIDMPIAIAPMQLGRYPAVSQDAPEKETGTDDAHNYFGKQYGAQAKALRLSSFFRTPEVWRAVGSQEDFTEWVQNQGCIVCGMQDYTGMDSGESKCEAAHVRRAGESGTSFKADYALVSMCHEHHRHAQHDHGETKAFREYLRLKNNAPERLVTEAEAKDWFNKKRIETVQAWCWDTLKTKLGYDSWAEISPIVLSDWAEKNAVFHYLPNEYQ